MNEEILKAVDEIADEMIEGIKRIVRIDSVESEAVNDAPFGEGVRHALDETLQLSRDLGFETVDVDHYIGYARYGKSDDYVCACGHLDVVPVGEGWKHPPFSAYEEDGVIYSRGILDNKGPILSCLYALTALKRLGIKPEREVRIIFGCDEESGFEDLKYYLDHEKAPIAGFTPDCKYPVVYAERGRAVIKVKADLDHLITFMNKYILNTQNKGERLGIDYKNDEFGQLEIRNYHLTKGDFSFSISYPAGLTLEEILDKLNRIEGYEYEVVSHFKPVYFDKKAPMVEIMKETYEYVTGNDGTPVTTTGGTYAKMMPHIVPFGPSFPGQKGIGHNPNEWMTREDLITNAKIYALTLYQLSRKETEL